MTSSTSRIDHLRRLLEYEVWANGRIFAAAEPVYPTDERIARQLSHIVHAHAIWLARVAGDEPLADAWQVLGFADLQAQATALQATWIDRLGIDELEQPVSYHDLRGKPWTTLLGDILQHVLNHSTYHRGQVAARLVALGQPAPSTDYIAFCRL